MTIIKFTSDLYQIYRAGDHVALPAGGGDVVIQILGRREARVLSGTHWGGVSPPLQGGHPMLAAPARR